MRVGDIAPDFTLNDQSGTPVALGSLIAAGPVVLFFYPAAMTAGCTKETCHFRDLQGEFAALGARCVGISMDSVDQQSRFAEKNALSFPLLADPGGAVARAYGVKRGLDLLRVKRTTFVVGTDSRVTHVYRSEFRPEAHADSALAALRSPQSAGGA